MLVDNSISGLGGLGCGDTPCAPCSAKKKGLGATDVMGASWCGSGNPFIDIFCSDASKKSTMEQIITDPSYYGKNLSPESIIAIENTTRNIIANDNPCNYSEINGMGWFDKLKCDLNSGNTNTSSLWIIGGAIVAGVLLVKHL